MRNPDVGSADETRKNTSLPEHAIGYRVETISSRVWIALSLSCAQNFEIDLKHIFDISLFEASYNLASACNQIEPNSTNAVNDRFPAFNQLCL